MPQEGGRHPLRHRLILDLRPPSDFHAFHLARSYQIEVCSLGSRYSYLPTREQPFLVIANVSERLTVLDAMKDYSAAQIVFLCYSQDLWRKIDGPVTEAGIFFEKAKDRGLLRSWSTPQSRLLSSDDVPTLLFQPSNAVKRLVMQIENSHTGTAQRRVLDLGCGAARDLIWILHRYRETQAKPGLARTIWRAVGLDNWKATLTRARKEMRELGLRHSEDAMQPACEALVWANCSDAGPIVPLAGTGKGKAIADDTSVAGEVESLRIIRGLGLTMDAADPLPEHLRYDLIICVRFYPLPTLSRLASLVKMNGYVLISHFVSLEEDDKEAVSQRQPSAIIDYDSPPHERRMRPGQIEELVQTWNASGTEHWVIHEDTFEPIEDGRIVRSVALRKGMPPS